MHETFCFAEQPRALFVEACARGYVAAARDYPHLKNLEESVQAAHALPNELRPQVCCIPVEEYAYWHLIVHAWVNGYWALCTSQESQIAQMVLALKPIPEDEAQALARFAVRQEDVTEVAEAYTRYATRTPVEQSR